MTGGGRSSSRRCGSSGGRSSSSGHSGGNSRRSSGSSSRNRSDCHNMIREEVRRSHSLFGPRCLTVFLVPAPRDAAGHLSTRPGAAAGPGAARPGEPSCPRAHAISSTLPGRWAQNDHFASLWVLERMIVLVAFPHALIPELLHYRRPTTDDCLLWRDHDDCL